ncbi:hypothetical protein GCM10025864_08490 [Luteimicrobium album]|uniref:Uncharacterized protein n=1 Tax=Luteimicrobium album TaxID=1054550 RepID=A0ABQ6HXJ3_9MICO|nr:hypothetical protein GCM10025864_08490 [Luteimicrobium album]
MAATTLALVPDDADQSETAFFTAVASASPLEPIMTVRALSDDVRFAVEVAPPVLPPVVSSFPLNPDPDPQALRARAAVAATAQPPSQREVLRCIVVSSFGWAPVVEFGSIKPSGTPVGLIDQMPMPATVGSVVRRCQPVAAALGWARL